MSLFRRFRLEASLDYGVRWQWRVGLPDGDLREVEQARAPEETPPQIGAELSLSLAGRRGKIHRLL